MGAELLLRPVLSLRLCLVLALALGSSGCDRRGAECRALREVVGGAPAADAGALPGDLAARAARAVSELDRLGVKSPDLTRPLADYRASLEGLGAAARAVTAEVEGLAAAVPAGGGGAPLDLAAEQAAFDEHIAALVQPCIEWRLAGLAPKGAARSEPKGCKALDTLVARIWTPDAGISVSAHASAIATALEGLEAEPGMAGAARQLGAQLRRIEPRFREVRTTAAELVSRAARLQAAQAALREAREKSAEKAGEIAKACPAR